MGAFASTAKADAGSSPSSAPPAIPSFANLTAAAAAAIAARDAPTNYLDLPVRLGVQPMQHLGRGFSVCCWWRLGGVGGGG
jgi:hypothetical protein